MTTSIFNFTTSSKATVLRVAADNKLADTVILHLDEEYVTAYPLAQFAAIYVAMGRDVEHTITTINKQMNQRMEELDLTKEDATIHIKEFSEDMEGVAASGDATVEEYTVKTLFMLIDEMMGTM